MATSITIWVDKTKLDQTQTHEETLPPLGEGEVRLRVESFSVTANNVTYAVVGDAFGYWNFFPAQGSFGVVPMWGHAVVEASEHPDIAVGERVYGYLPMGTHLDVLPGNVSKGSFTDMAAHRQPMSGIYNTYQRIAADPQHDPAREPQRMLFGPLFGTGFLIEAMFNRESWNGAEQLVTTSASSKTSMALASVARTNSPHIRRIGLTSSGNVAFVEASGIYDQVIAYGDIAALPQVPSVSVDFAGNSQLLRSIHEHLGDNLKYSCLVGATHVDARGAAMGSSDEPCVLPGPAPILFFAPDHMTALIAERGREAFFADYMAAWKNFLAATDGLVTIDERAGLDAAADAFVATYKGTADPSVGIIIRP